MKHEIIAAPVRLTALAHGGGCGCKLAPSVLSEILAGMPAGRAFDNLLVGIETGDDAAVYRINDHQALVATTDFFTPIVDDPGDFGRIAATNALSDIYAMGGSPLLALAIVGMPVGKIALDVVRDILAGGAAACAAAGIPIAGGHSIDAPEPIYGLAAIGLVHPDRILRNAGARPGDRLILTKGLGVGIYGAALKAGRLPADLYAAMVASTTQLNEVGRELPDIPGVHAVTDVTGFGLLGHALEICRASAVAAALQFADIPLLPGVAEFARSSTVTGASGRNWASYEPAVSLGPELGHWHRDVLCDPQTSGGLLIAADPAAVPTLLDLLGRRGLYQAAVIGRVAAGSPALEVD